MKKAFTMIELIFVIVIIGILSAVAIPKLAATRDDAQISSIVSNAKIAIADFESYYMSVGNTIWNTTTINNATSALLLTSCNTPIEANTSISPNTFVLCHDNMVCMSFETTEEGHLIVTDGTDTTDTICEAVKTDPAITNMSNKTYILGGEKIRRGN
jgi:prepilin-type N-terminal cleavage/methylation domain-containing protein